MELFLVLGSTHGRDQHGRDQARQKRAGPLESRVQDAALSVDFCWEACCCLFLNFLGRKQIARVQDEHDFHIGSGFVSPFQRCDDVGGDSVIPYDFAVLGEHCFSLAWSASYFGSIWAHSAFAFTLPRF